MATIPTTQRAAVRVGTGLTSKAPVVTIPVEKPGPDQILIKINWTGVCASDKSLLHDDWAPLGLSMLPSAKGIVGHEGAGVVSISKDSSRYYLHVTWQLSVSDLWKVKSYRKPRLHSINE